VPLLVKSKAEVAQKLPAQRRQVLGQIDHGLGHELAPEGNVLLQAAHQLAVVPVQGRDDHPDPRTMDETGMQTGGIEGETAVTAAVDQGKE
jgi:hypothetical protein